MMRPVQQQAPPPFGSSGGDNDRGAMWGLTADRLTVPCGEGPRTTEIGHISLSPGGAARYNK